MKKKKDHPGAWEWGIQEYLPDRQFWKTTVICKEKTDAERTLANIKATVTDERHQLRLIRIKKEVRKNDKSKN